MDYYEIQNQTKLHVTLRTTKNRTFRFECSEMFECPKVYRCSFVRWSPNFKYSMFEFLLICKCSLFFTQIRMYAEHERTFEHWPRMFNVRCPGRHLFTFCSTNWAVSHSSVTKGYRKVGCKTDEIKCYWYFDEPDFVYTS